MKLESGDTCLLGSNDFFFASIVKPEESMGINGNMYHVKDVNVNFSALLNSGCAFSSVSGVLIQT